VQTRWELYW